MEEKSEKIFQIENSLALKSVDKSNDNNNNNKNNDLNRNISESDSEDLSDGSDEEISKFDKYIYTFLLCYANLTYVGHFYKLFSKIYRLKFVYLYYF